MSYVPSVTKRYAVGLGDDVPLCSVAMVGQQCIPDDQTGSGTPVVVVPTVTPSQCDPKTQIWAGDQCYTCGPGKAPNAAGKCEKASATSSFPILPVLGFAAAGALIYLVLSPKKKGRR